MSAVLLRTVLSGLKTRRDQGPRRPVVGVGNGERDVRVGYSSCPDVYPFPRGRSVVRPDGTLMDRNTLLSPIIQESRPTPLCWSLRFLYERTTGWSLFFFEKEGQCRTGYDFPEGLDRLPMLVPVPVPYPLRVVRQREKTSLLRGSCNSEGVNPR